jgi:aminocarboxymuconate-semialdehyde decarboxylase
MDRDGVAVQVLSPIPVPFSFQATAAGATELAAVRNDFFAWMVGQHLSRWSTTSSTPTGCVAVFEDHARNEGRTEGHER